MPAPLAPATPRPHRPRPAAKRTHRRRLATDRCRDNAAAKQVFYRHGPGIHGPLVPANGLVMRERGLGPTSDPAKWAIDPGAWQGPRDQFCTDFEGSIAALVDSAGLVEQYRYSNSGVPHGIPPGDLNGDGEVDAGGSGVDDLIWLAAKTTYEVRADLDLDGDVDADDGAIITAHNGNSTGRGRLSIATIREIYGWGQYKVFGEGLHTVWATTDAAYLSGLALQFNGSLYENERTVPQSNLVLDAMTLASMRGPGLTMCHTATDGLGSCGFCIRTWYYEPFIGAARTSLVQGATR